ncbi:Protein of uncharacterised function (DUF3052) [Mycobacteroides abscessus subsp. abscessus]|nr:Protein of uncharacterised function (DUF3052) [Mycobacteroides abscessus subsp. abscessus]
MVAAADASNYARKLGIQRDQLVQELGWDEDTDDDIRADIEDACGSELLIRPSHPDRCPASMTRHLRGSPGHVLDSRMDLAHLNFRPDPGERTPWSTFLLLRGGGADLSHNQIGIPIVPQVTCY